VLALSGICPLGDAACESSRLWLLDDENVANGGIVIASGPSRSFEKPRSLTEAISAIKVYLEDCVADPAEEGIGGHIHIAKFTPEGFGWIQPPQST
jgi:hypothetical protein